MNKNELPSRYHAGEEYVKDKNLVSMRFDIQFYSPGSLEPFEFFYKKRKITGVQEGRYLKVSFTEKLPRSLVDDIAWGRNNAERYVYGYLFVPIQRVNQELLRQRYSLGHFLINTFSFFDIANIKLTNADENPTDEIISMPWPPVFAPPPHVHFADRKEFSNPEIFMRDYIDAWNDFFRGDYDSCVRRMVTSVENALSFYELHKKEQVPWWNIPAWFRRKSSFRGSVNSLFKGSDYLGHKVVRENLLFFYNVRNKITHEALRIHPENGWWFCLKGLKTVQYLYQFLDGKGENSRGAYVFRTYAFADFLFIQTRGSTVEVDAERINFMNDESADHESLQIKDDKDMDEWQFGSMRINDRERACILKNKPRG